MTRVAVVTGSNKGVGLGIVEGLCKKFDGHVYLTSRDEGRGIQSVEGLKAKGLFPHFHQLDITSKDSIMKLRDFLKEKYGGLDVLVNNAGIAFKNAATEPMSVQAKVTLATNYFATKQACEVLFPLLREGARVVNVSSSLGFLPKIGESPASLELRKKLATSDSTLTTQELDDMMNDYVKSTEDGTFKEKGWPSSTYVVSKIGLSALSRIQNRELQASGKKDIALNHAHPGYVDTDMSSHKGPLTIEQGAKSSIYLALLEPGTAMTGKYIWYDCQEVDWVNGPCPGN